MIIARFQTHSGLKQRYKSLRKLILILFIIILFPRITIGQKSGEFLTERPGRWILTNTVNRCPGLNTTAFESNLSSIAEWVHQNDIILNPTKGFDAAVNLSGNLCDHKTSIEDYGIQGLVSFSFRYFYINNGKMETASGWLAHGTEILVNNPIRFTGTQFDEAGFNTGDPAHLKQPLEKALANLKQYYFVAPVKREIEKGVRLYSNGAVVVFNPERPEMWIPVTVKEVMEAKLAYYKIKNEIDSIKYEKMLAAWAKLNFKPDNAVRPNTYNIIKAEYDEFSPDKLNQPAYYSSSEKVSQIGTYAEGKLMVARFNTACWDKSLPPAAVQFLSMEYKPASPSELEGFKRRNGGLTDYVGLFYNSLPLERTHTLIHKP